MHCNYNNSMYTLNIPDLEYIDEYSQYIEEYEYQIENAPDIIEEPNYLQKEKKEVEGLINEFGDSMIEEAKEVGVYYCTPEEMLEFARAGELFYNADEFKGHCPVFFSRVKEEKEFCPLFWENSKEIFPRCYFQLNQLNKTDLNEFLAYVVSYARKENCELIEDLILDFTDYCKTKAKIDEFNEAWSERYGTF